MLVLFEKESILICCIVKHFGVFWNMNIVLHDLSTQSENKSQPDPMLLVLFVSQHNVQFEVWPGKSENV